MENFININKLVGKNYGVFSILSVILKGIPFNSNPLLSGSKIFNPDTVKKS